MKKKLSINAQHIKKYNSMITEILEYYNKDIYVCTYGYKIRFINSGITYMFCILWEKLGFNANYGSHFKLPSIRNFNLYLVDKIELLKSNKYELLIPFFLFSEYVQFQNHYGHNGTVYELADETILQSMNENCKFVRKQIKERKYKNVL